MALVFAATVANRWFVRRRGLVMGVLTAGNATGQLVFLPVVAAVDQAVGWRVASFVIAACALLVVPLVLLLLRDRPQDLGVLPYGADPSDPPEPVLPGRGAARRAVQGLRRPPRARARSGRCSPASRSAGPPPTA